MIPVSLRKRILKEFHIGHSEMNRMKLLMRIFVYWSEMDSDIKHLVKSCRGCARAEKSPPMKFESWSKTDTITKYLTFLLFAIITYLLSPCVGNWPPLPHHKML